MTDLSDVLSPLKPDDEETRKPASPLQLLKTELLSMLTPDAVDVLEPDSARQLSYELQRLATAMAKGREAESRWRELSSVSAPVDHSSVRNLGFRMLKYSFALRRASTSVTLDTRDC